MSSSINSKQHYYLYCCWNLKWNHHIIYLHRIASTTSFQNLNFCKSTDINILKKFFLKYICHKLEHNKLSWFPYLKKEVNHIEFVHRIYTRFLFNRCNISYMSYIDKLTKLNIRSLGYRRLEYKLTTFKLVKGETTTNIQSIFKLYTTNNLLRENSKKKTYLHNFNSKAWDNFFISQSKYGTNFQIN